MEAKNLNKKRISCCLNTNLIRIFVLRQTICGKIRHRNYPGLFSCSILTQQTCTFNMEVCYWDPTTVQKAGKAASPVTEVVHCTEGVTGTRQAAAGAVGEVSLLAVLTLQTDVARQTLTLTSVLITIIRIHNPLAATAAVTKALWRDKRGRHRKEERQEIRNMHEVYEQWQGQKTKWLFTFYSLNDQFCIKTRAQSIYQFASIGLLQIYWYRCIQYVF